MQQNWQRHSWNWEKGESENERKTAGESTGLYTYTNTNSIATVLHQSHTFLNGGVFGTFHEYIKRLL